MGPEERLEDRVHGKLGIYAARIRREHVRIGLLAPFGPVEDVARDRDPCPLRVFRGEEEERAPRDDPDGALGDRALDRVDDGGGARLIVDDERNDLVPVDPALRFCKGTRARKPTGASAVWDAATPVSEATNATVIGLLSAEAGSGARRREEQ